ncbi:MAG: hypothetical protein KC917_10825 [Candidatus Omnitrophica bacterium]|nr:hypothetical protein [Candidatus Omnitrophota bacterium]MCB9769108.1 hypothetical protein [Candidatus Omnitrophota bacterium]
MNFFSQFVFGFMLAQVVPGLICTFFLFFLSVGWKIITTGKQVGYSDYLAQHAQNLAMYPSWLFCLFIGATCLGVLIHWFNWMIVARLEQRSNSLGTPGLENIPWHRRSITVQIVMWPIDLVRELLLLFLGTPNFEKTVRLEKRARVSPDRFPALARIEDFYLPFAQFLTNLSWALIPAFFSIFLVFTYSGFTPRRLLFAIGCYLVIGATRVLARHQLITLDLTERELLKG